MSIFQLATVLIYVTSVLTSSDNQTLNNDRSQPNTALKGLFGSPQITTEITTLSTDTKAINKNDSDTVKPDTKDSINTEGGPVRVTSITTETKSSVTADSPNKDESSPGLKPSEEKSATKHSRIQPRKEAIPEEPGTEVSSKGVTLSEDLLIKSSTEAQMLNTIKSSTELPVEIKPSSSVIKNVTDQSSPTDINLEKKPETNNTKHVPNVMLVKNGQNMPTPKHKPTSTTGEGDDDGKGMPSSPTQKQIGMPRKVDYIVPLVITIMATPVLGIAAYILYTRGRDCWDKRHYRRMDFLVDGMYND